MFRGISRIFLFTALLMPVFSQAQDQGVIKGRVYDAVNNEPVMFANVLVQNTQDGSATDVNGTYSITGLKPGLYNLVVTYVGYKQQVVYEVQVTNAKPAQVDIALEPSATQLDEAVVRASPFTKLEESPLSLRTIGTSEIERNPGGNRDISRVIQSLPGVASTVSFRNDIIIRGGAPNENRFYLDGIEVPNINHFATQGSSGGPVGMINVDFIRKVDFYSGAFPATRGNALSSVFEFTQKDPRTDRLGLKGTVGASDLGITIEGPIDSSAGFMFSARRSYLQLLFQLLELPFLPTYNDFQLKTKITLNPKSELLIIGLGAIDQFALNTSANETELQRYILGNLPSNEQWNYTGGIRYRRFGKKGYTTLVLSRNHLQNTAIKFRNNDETNPDGLLLNYSSAEIENKARTETQYRIGDYKLVWGTGYEYAIYTNSTFNRLALPGGRTELINFSSRLDLHKYSAFGQISETFFSERLTASAGMRMDGNSYSAEMSNPLEQFSPRVALSYALAERLNVNFTTGIYYQLPPYTVLGYRDSAGTLVNKQNEVTYIRSHHWVGGLEYTTENNARITIEAFRKNYSNYPFLLQYSISLANLGGDFGVIGNEPVSSTSNGLSYGAEFLMQQKLFKGYYGIVAYTFVRSKFENRFGELIPAAWDNRHILTLTGGKKFKKDWELGVKWRYLGGGPYTPLDIRLSSLQNVWDVTAQGIPDYSRLNENRLPATHQLDIRVDKKYFFEKWSLNLYFDVQNIYNYQTRLPAFLNVSYNEEGQPITDPSDPSRYQTYLLENITGTVLPTLGVIIEI